MSAATGYPASDADPFSVEFFDDPFPHQDALREAGAAVRLSRYGVWVIARYAEVSKVLNDWQTFTSARGVGLADFAKEKPWRPPSLVLEADPPLHDRARSVLNRVLSPGAVRNLRTAFASAAERLVDELVADGEFDAVPALAEAFPLSVFPDAVGVAREGRHLLLTYGNLTFDALGPRSERLDRKMAEAAAAIAWVQAQTQRAALGEGLGSAIHAAVDEGAISADEAPLLVRSLLSAGLDTTVASLGAALHCLARFPEQFQRLRDEPGLARAAFEEAIRLESPVQHFFRTTTRKADIGGTTIGEGEKVLLLFGAANRDPRRWERADEYDISRSSAGHVAFGAGIHMCVGQVLARLEGEVVLTALARKARSMTIGGPVRYRFNNTLRSLESLPIRLH
ncbi:MAG TPA: cytochrome P450 [Acetobacteraceae bacterium]|nr:cytochrome P450 [Acetobacteraceae bacterium]